MNRGHGDAIKALLLAGKPYGVIVAEVGVSKATISYHARGLGLAKVRLTYDWPEVQRYYDAGHTRDECMAHFGFAALAWDKARRRGALKTRQRGRSLQAVLALAPTHRGHLKRRLLRAGLLVNKCTLCGITDWMDEPLVLRLDHINGNKDDNRLENLRLICPNCDSQLDTFASRNKPRVKAQIWA